MALLPNINVGTSPNDGTGDSIRDAFTIVNENFQLIEAFFPNSSVSNLVANITSTGTSVFNIANIDTLNVNTVSSYTTTNVTISNNLTVTNTGIFDAITANSIGVTNITIDGDISANITSTGNSAFNITSFSNAATFESTVFIGNILTVDDIDANLGTIDTLNTTTLSVGGAINVTGNTINNFGENSAVIFQGNVKANARFFTNTVTISSSANLAVDFTRAQTIIANLTAGNLTVTLPNADINFSDGLYYTFICYDEGGLSNRTLTVNVQPGAANIWTSANTQATFVNIGAELGTNSVEVRTNETYWFTF